MFAIILLVLASHQPAAPHRYNTEYNSGPSLSFTLIVSATTTMVAPLA